MPTRTFRTRIALTRALLGGAALVVVLVDTVAAQGTIVAQSARDSAAVMRGLGSRLNDDPAIRQLRDSLAVYQEFITPFGAPARTGSARASDLQLLRVLARKLDGRVSMVPGPGNTLDERLKSAEPASLLAGALGVSPVVFAGDSAVVRVYLTFSHAPRPSTFSERETDYVLRRQGTQWQVSGEQVRMESHGVYEHAPLENLRGADREIQATRHAAKPLPGKSP